MSQNCIECGSYAINHHCHGRDGSDGELCDVCYWRKRAGELDKPTMLVIQESKDLKHRCDELLAALDDITKIKWRDGLAGIDRPTDFAERESAIRALGSAMIIARSAISKAKGV